MADSYDLKIVNGTVVDGTGAPGRQADVAVKGGKIVAVGDCPGEAAETLDAAGLHVLPGFVDIHTHYDGQVSWDAELAPSCYHGVTTAVMGNCGVGFAPVRKGDRTRLIELMEGVEDIPGTALAEGITWDWESFPEYLDAISNRPHVLDFAAYIPHDALRVYVMGDRAMAQQAATEEDISTMRTLVRQALEAGAIGFSTGRTDNHRDAQGNHTPASEATVRELTGIAEAFHGLDHGVLQAVSDFDMLEDAKRFDQEFDVLEDMVKASNGHRLSISLLQRVRSTNQWRKIVERCEQADAKGTPIRMQVAARGIGVLLGLQATFHPFMAFPSYLKIADLPLTERVAKMRDPEFKKQLLSEKSGSVSDGTSVPTLADQFLQNLEFVAMRLFRFGGDFDYEPDVKTSILAQAQEQGKNPLEIIYDLMLEDEGRELLYFPIYNYMGFNLDAVHEMITHPLSLPGLSDGGAHVGTICDASFPTYMLTHWTRDRKKGEKLPLEKVVAMMTRDNAQYMGFRDRGVLEPGMKADINVVDYQNLDLDRPHLAEDLPAGGKRLLQNAKGYKATFVSGVKVIADDQLTGATPGQLVRLTS